MMKKIVISMKKLSKLFYIFLLILIGESVGSVIGISTVQLLRHSVNIFSNYRIFMFYMKETLIPGLLVGVPSAFLVVLIVDGIKKK